jgi:hypothetical protein
LLGYCEVNNHQLQDASEYGELGYDTPANGVLVANWNNIPQSLQDRLEHQGYALEWEDEWYVDCDHSPSKAYRTSPDCHEWESCVRYIDGDVLTPDDDPSDWIEDALNNDNGPLPSWFDESELETEGFTKLDQRDKEIGFHPGQDQTPDSVGIPALRAKGFDTVLQITDKGQFDVRYCVWTRPVAVAEVAE